MLYQQQKLLNDLLFGSFALFIFGSTFSIALAQVALGLSLILFIIVAIGTRYNPFVAELKWFYIFTGLYIVWMFIASLLGDTPVESLLIMKEEWLFSAIPIGIYLMSRDNYRRTLLTAFAVGIGVFTLYGLLQFFTGVHWTKPVPPNPGREFGYVIKGNFPSPMTFGNFFGTAGAFFAGYVLGQWSKLDNTSKVLYGGAALTAILGTIGSYNRGAIVGLFVGFVVLSLLLRNRKILLGTGAIVALVVVLVIIFPGPRQRLSEHFELQLSPAYEGGRVFIWNNSLKIVAEHPVFGVGQGNFRYEYLKLLRPDIPDRRKRVHAHNDFINVATIAGVPGMLFFAGIWIAVFCYVRRQIKTAENRASPLLVAALTGSVVFLVSSLTESTFADEEVRQMLMFIWATGLFAMYPRLGNSAGTSEQPGSKSS
ncbi:MAG: O-antigen ligase family protein [Candidatus Zixiibacteriota bacterium]|nr:MAG: O-antigen ligase family protein [candidate division Zixibacteria bacterium]